MPVFVSGLCPQWWEGFSCNGQACSVLERVLLGLGWFHNHSPVFSPGRSCLQALPWGGCVWVAS